MPISKFETIMFDCFKLESMLPELKFSNRKNFAEVSYERWASDEIVDYVREYFDGDIYRPIDDYIEAIQVFAFDMEEYLSISSDNSLMFEIAEALAYNVIDLLNALK